MLPFRSGGTCNPDGRVCGLGSGEQSAASIFRGRESLVEYLVICACLVWPSSVGLGPCWLQEGLRPLDGFQITSLIEVSLLFFLEHGAVEMLREQLLGAPGSAFGKMNILTPFLMVQRHSKMSVST